MSPSWREFFQDYDPQLTDEEEDDVEARVAANVAAASSRPAAVAAPAGTADVVETPAGA